MFQNEGGFVGQCAASVQRTYGPLLGSQRLPERLDTPMDLSRRAAERA
jgi:hypothetical protein